jgi:D-sedoheptulose 7-phosphate isomerase
MKTWIAQHFNEFRKAMLFDKTKIESFINLLNETRLRGNTIYVVGNGGSASNASHFAQDLTKGASDALILYKKTPFKCVSLTDNVPWITAIANDIDYNKIFEEQLSKLAIADDVLIALSVSGTSANVVNAAHFAKENHIKVVSITGKRRNKNSIIHLADVSDLWIEINSEHFGLVEDSTMSILHSVAYYFQENAHKEVLS